MSPESVQSYQELLLPFLFILLSLVALIVWIFVWHRRRMHEIDCRHKERMAAIEKGLDLPPDTLPERTLPRSRHLLRGLIWLGVGVAITFGAHWSPAPLAGSGWIAVAVGAAYLIFYLVEGRSASVQKREDSSSDTGQRP